MSGDGAMKAQTEFERFALNHQRHNHCQGCGGCLLDPSPVVQGYQSWCVGCRDRIKATCARSGAPAPWRGGWESCLELRSDFGAEDEFQQLPTPDRYYLGLDMKEQCSRPWHDVKLLVERWERDLAESETAGLGETDSAVRLRDCLRELRALLVSSPHGWQHEHLAFVAVMNALDIHMPPDGEALLRELREIAATVGYPWLPAPPLASASQEDQK